jgi:hypothetical protein
MINKIDNSLYQNKSKEELNTIARKKNDAELDRLCNNCCLCLDIGVWSSVLVLFIYLIYNIFQMP